MPTMPKRPRAVAVEAEAMVAIARVIKEREKEGRKDTLHLLQPLQTEKPIPKGKSVEQNF